MTASTPALDEQVGDHVSTFTRLMKPRLERAAGGEMSPRSTDGGRQDDRPDGGRVGWPTWTGSGRPNRPWPGTPRKLAGSGPQLPCPSSSTFWSGRRPQAAAPGSGFIRASDRQPPEGYLADPEVGVRDRRSRISGAAGGNSRSDPGDGAPAGAPVEEEVIRRSTSGAADGSIVFPSASPC
jgi:hypothetical protein